MVSSSAKHACVREVRERISVALMRELADQLVDGITGAPHPALAKAKVFVHTAWRASAVRSGDEDGADGQPELCPKGQLQLRRGWRAAAAPRGDAAAGVPLN